ncbi:nuclear pore complex protein NUP88-like [Zingiber officinale]|uniref:nuclear pore complex protein NUP88-like n=1 Tax=Zingiber officinale TaxID=94328 RepID=UPI001C4CBEA6|nr:nuclear pore complex protein NUP88-like [Zingiber officinale]
MTRITAPDDEDGDGDSPPLPTPPPPFRPSPSASASSRTPSQRAPPDFHSSSPTLPSFTSTRPPPQWVPLGKHRFFSSVDGGGSSTGESLNHYPRSSNLLSWDADSSRLYVWDPLSQSVLRLSLRFRDPEPPSSLSAVLEAAIPFEVLASDIQIEDKVDHISLNIDGSLLLLSGSNNVRIMHINDKTPAIEQLTCRTDSVAAQLFCGLNNGLQILQVSWHPYSSCHIGILSSDSIFRLFNLSCDVEHPEQEYYLQPTEPGRCQSAASFCPMAFSFGGEHLWDRFSVFFVFSDGSVFVLCPIVPFGSSCRRSHIEEIQSDITMFGLNPSYSESVCNAHLAIDWLEATYPELKGHLVEGDNTLVLVAHPYAPIDASLSLQGPLTKVYLREGNTNSEVDSAIGEGRVVGFLYKSVGKDSVLIISWSSGQLQIDALADEVQPQWNIDASPHIYLDSNGHIKGIAMICEPSPREILNEKLCLPLSNISATDKTNLGHPPHLVRLAIVDLALPMNVLHCLPLSLFPDPLLTHRFYCLHGGGIDLIALQFLPFTDLDPGTNVIGKPPSVYPIIDTCSSKSCSTVFGFAPIADLYGHSQIVSLLSSYEFVVLEMEAWDELLHFHYDDDGKSNANAEGHILDILSKRVLTGSKAIPVPSSTSLRTLNADSIDGRATLHHYIKLFRENYVEYGHKVYIELKEHSGYLHKVLKEQHKRLSEAKQSIANAEADIKNRIVRAFKVYELLDQRLQNFRSLPGANKKPLTRAESEFKAELDRFAEVELDALHSAIQALSARLKRFYQSSPASAGNPMRQAAKSRKNVSDQQLLQLRSSLERLSLLNKENIKNLKQIEGAQKNLEK